LAWRRRECRKGKVEGDEGWDGVTCGVSCDFSPPFFDQGSYAAATMAVEVLLEDGRWNLLHVGCQLGFSPVRISCCIAGRVRD
jgi:hypothetical protein